MKEWQFILYEIALAVYFKIW